MAQDGKSASSARWRSFSLGSSRPSVAPDEISTKDKLERNRELLHKLRDLKSPSPPSHMVQKMREWDRANQLKQQQGVSVMQKDNVTKETDGGSARDTDVGTDTPPGKALPRAAVDVESTKTP